MNQWWKLLAYVGVGSALMLGWNLSAAQDSLVVPSAVETGALGDYLPKLIFGLGMGLQFIRAANWKHRTAIYLAAAVVGTVAAYLLTREAPFPEDLRLAVLQSGSDIADLLSRVLGGTMATSLLAKGAVALGMDPNSAVVPVTQTAVLDRPTAAPVG